MNFREQRAVTRDLLAVQVAMHPKLQVWDVFKFLYQSAFGCEHLVPSEERATEYIATEAAAMSPFAPACIEPLVGGYSRVPLSVLDRGISVQTLGRLFAASAKKEADGLETLLRLLKIARQRTEEGGFPFSLREFDTSAEEWSVQGFPAVHHSETFREAYRPSYRVISNEYLPYLELFARLDRLCAQGPAVIAVEGGSASGKTSLGRILERVYGCTVFHMDDFFLPPQRRTPERLKEVGGNVDWERFLSEVLLPLRRGETVALRRFDCATGTFSEPCTVVPRGLTVVEGAYSMHPALASHYDFSVFLDISSELQTARIHRRNSPAMVQRFLNEWIPLERTYFEQTSVVSRCNLRIFSADTAEPPRVHEMRLQPEPYGKIKRGEKTFELRLFDEKRRRLRVGDRIVFTEADSGERLISTVAGLHRFDTFGDLYDALPLLKCGYTDDNVAFATPDHMARYYSAAEQARYGVVGIELCDVFVLDDVRRGEFCGV